DGGLVPCPGGPDRMPGRKRQDAVHALSWADVEAIRDRFAALNPYDRAAVPGSILKLEKENRDATGRQRQLWCYAISAKRYALYIQDETTGHLQLVKWSEHGLGYLLNPTDPDADEESGDADRDWIRGLWEGMVREALGLAYTWPAWLDRPA